MVFCHVSRHQHQVSRLSRPRASPSRCTCPKLPVSRGVCQVSKATHSSSSGSSTSVKDVPDTRHNDDNPLELLRTTTDPQTRAALFSQLDRNMSFYSELYQPCAVEEFLSKELGVWSYNVMLFAVQHPALQQFSLDAHVKPAVRSLLAAGLDHTDIWFIITKRLELLAEPISLQRWLDFMAAQAQVVSSRDMTTFLLRAPQGLFSSCTQAQALKVLSFLKRDLGVKEEYLFPRIVCAAPGVLLQDVDTQLQPILDYLTSLGLDAQHAARMACVYPELLLSSVQEQLQPLVKYLQGLGCSHAQVARLLQEVPQALRSKPQDVFGSRIAALQQLGVEGEALRSVVGRSTVFLTTKGAPQEQLAFLREELGFSTEQVRHLVVSCPAILAEKPLELQRKVDFLKQELNMELADLSVHPTYLGASLMQVIGPRHAFAVSKGLEARLRVPGGACSSSRIRQQGGAWAWDLSLLVRGEDVDFVDALGGSVNEYEGFRTAFEEEYTTKLSVAAAKEFQDELKKLGIYEGA